MILKEISKRIAYHAKRNSMIYFSVTFNYFPGFFSLFIFLIFFSIEEESIFITTLFHCLFDPRRAAFPLGICSAFKAAKVC